MRSLPRLLLAVDSLEVGGAERHVVELASALRRKDYGVEVSCSVAGELEEPLQAAGVPVWPLTRRLVKRRVRPAYARGIGKLLKERRGRPPRGRASGARSRPRRKGGSGAW
jgi:hypothetical protein